MASASHTAHGTSWLAVTRPIITLASRVHSEWRHRQTERMLESLPSEIRKDIGWPTTDDAAGRVH